MKKSLILFLALFSIVHVYGQKFGYVDTDYVLGKMPEYKEAQGEINKLSLGWQEEIKEMSRKIESMYNELQAEEVLLTAEMKKDRMAEISRKEGELKEYQKKIFGFEGLFFLKKKELIKPVQDKVFEAIERVCKDQRLAIMFDKAGDMVMIYTDPRHDYTDYVLEELGLGDPNDVIK
ncbi:Outer membrane protein H precursor [Fulvivirga imtechensis AK7]|uniref:Outer membrane protein H n=1 Tax=Fulvivirga imtechensis AK7 TaxID=1237149 RepID=L8JR90_9BACT|nr:OmpH family outer membrane protein [Fulvivirga imtechensis]ELR71380.1 Outer membrane protein H precursor [Fulvivirga imtechensis AK7]